MTDPIEIYLVVATYGYSSEQTLLAYKHKKDAVRDVADRNDKETTDMGYYVDAVPFIQPHIEKPGDTP